MPDPTSPDCCGSGCCRRSGFWLCSQAWLREGVTQAKGWEVEGKGSQLETCGPPLEGRGWAQGAAWAPHPRCELVICQMALMAVSFLGLLTEGYLRD